MSFFYSQYSAFVYLLSLRSLLLIICLVIIRSVFFFFFFSSRRRHTRLTCDWSSDVCSSDLVSTISEAYRKIRNTMRYLLGNLYDFDPHTDMVPAIPRSIDGWMLLRIKA